MKESGLGRRHGPEGIRKLCHQQTVVVDRFGLKSELDWFPGSATRLAGLKRMMRLLFHSDWRKTLFA